MNTTKIVLENIKRREIPLYDPYTGEGAPLERELLEIADFYLPQQYVPLAMFNNPLVQAIVRAGSIEAMAMALDEEYTPEVHEKIADALIKVRIKHDFFYWAASFGTIKNKEGSSNIPFVLNRPQRRLVEKLERMRLAGKPIRIIVLKARQWGGSTAIQIYMAWIQLVHLEGWYSAIIAQDNSSARRIQAMYSKLLKEYPPKLLGLPEAELEFGSYGKSANDSIIKQKGKAVRDTVISIGSVVSPDSIRSSDIALCHFSEVGIWKETEQWNASSIIRSVTGSILNRPMTMIAFESTANGTGNYFHTEWLRAKKPDNHPEKSSMEPIFVPWYEIELYSLDFEDEASMIAFADWLIDNRYNEKPSTYPDAGTYYWWLWGMGATLENIHWYVDKRRTYADHADMAAEYPSDDIEAFKHSGQKVFDLYKVEELRKSCFKPVFLGDISAESNQGYNALHNIKFVANENGNLKIWEYPDLSKNMDGRYLVVVDPQKGASKTADYSCIVVIDRYWRMYGGTDEIVAEWHGHIDKDLLAWKAAQLSTMYDKALLVIERNTYDNDKGKTMDQGEFIIDTIAEHYDNMYVYIPMGRVIEKESPSIGFFTNKGTKPAIVNHLIAIVRELGYVERNERALDELNVYELKDDGNWGAMKGKNDEHVIVRAIGLWISDTQMDAPSEKKSVRVRNKHITSDRL